MKTRVIVGAVLMTILFLLLYFGGYVLITAIALLAFSAVYELARISRSTGANPIVVPAYVFALSFGFVYRLLGFEMMAALYLICLVVSITALLLSKNRCARDSVLTLFILVYPILPIVCMMLCYSAFELPDGLTAACLAYVAPQFADALAYFGGTLLGKHKLCPHISPKKTVEGSVFAVVGGVLFGVLLIPVQRLWGGVIPCWMLLACGLLMGIFSQIGDLFASTLKRWANVKDFSSVFPGHGGIMDRIDSILVCAPIVLVFFTILSRFGIH